MTAPVVVIGRGLAGASAAFAAQAAGASVLVLGRDSGATKHVSGAWRILPQPCGVAAARADQPDLAECFAAFTARHPLHPYAVLGAGAKQLVAALDLLVPRVAPLLEPVAESSLQRWLPTPAGTILPAFTGALSQLQGDLRDEKIQRVAVLGFAGAPAWPAKLIAQGLETCLTARRKIAFEPLVLEEPLRGRDDAQCPADLLAARIDAAPGFAETVAAELRRRNCRADLFLFPPILGLARHGEIAQALSRELKAAVAELVSFDPSVPGLRLWRALEQALKGAGVELRQGVAASLSIKNGTVAGVRLASGEELPAKAVVLAAGGLVGGGLQAGDPPRALFPDLPLWLAVKVDGHPRWAPAEKEYFAAHAVGRQAADRQAGLTLGLRVDAAARILDRHAQPLGRNLFAAGALLGGSEPLADTGAGVAALSGMIAGKMAAAA